MFSHLAFRVFLTIIAGSILTAHAGDFYKWVDSQGSTHYSQSPPTEQKSTLVTTYDDGAGSTYNKPPTTLKIVAEQTKENTQPPKAKKDAKLCQQAKKNIRVLSSRPMIMQEGKLLTIDEKNKQIDAAKTIADIHC